MCIREAKKVQNQTAHQAVKHEATARLAAGVQQRGGSVGRQLETLILLRASQGLRQKDVASRVGITTSYYGMIEQGVRTPQLRIAYRLANFFNTSIEAIFFAK